MKTIKKDQLSKFLGGGEVNTSKETKIKSCGTTMTETVTDKFDDKNGDGIWGPGESGTKTTDVRFSTDVSLS